MSQKDQVYTLMNDGVRRSAQRIAQHLNIPVQSVRRVLQELKQQYPDTIFQSRDPNWGMLYWRK